MTTKTAAIYTRISLDKTGEALGVDRQEQTCRELAARLGADVMHVYSDNDKSAYNGKIIRHDFEKMLVAMDAGEFDLLICWHPDRLARTAKDTARWLDAARAGGLVMESVTGGSIDPNTATGAMVATILGSVATNESAHKSERQRAAAVQKAASGRPQWRRAFGYLPYTGTKEADTGQRLPDPVTGPLVAEAYRMLLARESLGAIMTMLNTHEWVDADNTVRRGCYGLNGHAWTRSTVSLFLRDARNAGLRSHNGELVRDKSGQPIRGTWAPLVDPRTWHAAQERLSDPRRAPGKKSVQKHLLTGLLFCGKCGHHLSGHKTATGTGAYNCKACRGVAVRAADIEPYVFGLVADRLARPDAVDLLKADLDEAEAAKIRAELAALYARLESIGVAVGEGDLTISQARAATDTVNAKIVPLERRQQDSERLRIFADLPLGDPAIVDALDGLPDGRCRAIVDLLATITIAPVGKGGHFFNPDRVVVDWK